MSAVAEARVVWGGSAGGTSSYLGQARQRPPSLAAPPCTSLVVFLDDMPVTHTVCNICLYCVHSNEMLVYWSVSCLHGYACFRAILDDFGYGRCANVITLDQIMHRPSAKTSVKINAWTVMFRASTNINKIHAFVWAIKWQIVISQVMWLGLIKSS